MHVHLPKAFHGWRELAKEVGIIVLGVLIALGFEQLVQIWHWRNETRMTRQELASELSYDALFAGERVGIEECLRDRIKALTAKLNDAGGHWTADPMVFGKPRKAIAGNVLVTGIPSASTTLPFGRLGNRQIVGRPRPHGSRRHSRFRVRL